MNRDGCDEVPSAIGCADGQAGDEDWPQRESVSMASRHLWLPCEKGISVCTYTISLVSRWNVLFRASV